MTGPGETLRRLTPADERVAQLERQIAELRVYDELPQEVLYEARIRALRSKKQKERKR